MGTEIIRDNSSKWKLDFKHSLRPYCICILEFKEVSLLEHFTLRKNGMTRT